MSKELYLNPFKRDAAPQPKPGAITTPPKLLPAMPPADLRLLPSHELATSNLHLNRIKEKVLPALSAIFENFYTSGLSKAAGSPMRGFAKDDIFYLPMLWADSNVSYGMGVRRVVRSLSSPHEKIKVPTSQFKSVKNPDAHIWVGFTQASLDCAVKQGVAGLATEPGHQFEVVSAELVLKNKANGKEKGEEITLFIALAC